MPGNEKLLADEMINNETAKERSRKTDVYLLLTPCFQYCGPSSGYLFSVKFASTM
jgi:hypothetical protein